MIRTTSFLAIVFFCALLSACGSDDTEVIDACVEVEGNTYYSVDQYECGPGENGVEMCNWQISFSRGTYNWSYSDIGDIGGYTCEGPNITSTGSSIEFVGHIDGETGMLTWNSIEYQLP